jgi:hypothetical protein
MLRHPAGAAPFAFKGAGLDSSSTWHLPATQTCHPDRSVAPFAARSVGIVATHPKNARPDGIDSLVPANLDSPPRRV